MEETVDITDTNAHFYSKKPLTDPSLQMQTPLFEELCQGAGITRPSRIQSLSWPVLSTGKHTIVADQTGSGKTLAYLLPLLKRALETPPGAKKKKYGAPKVLILAPTAELADQIRTVCAKISQTVPFNTMVVTANGKYTTSIRDQIRMIQRQPIDVLISTPGRVSTILRTRNSGLDFTDLQTIVLDEVDILLIDDTFGPQLRTVGEAAPALEKTQFVFVTATLPDAIVTTVQEEFPGVVQIRGPGLHRTAPSLKETLVDVSVPAEFNRDAGLCFDVKAKQLLKALRTNKCRRTLVFCNTVESCREVENLLNRKDRRGQLHEVGAYHNAMTPEARNTNLRDFAKGDASVDSVLICTDRAARGVDFDAAPVNHVVVFDFPKDPAEYVRRVGRTARAGRKGACTVFAHGWQLPVARNVMGTKADVNFKIAVNDVDVSHGDDDEKNYQYRKKHRKHKKSKSAMIKEYIKNGKLWDA
jgi:ATP-dependent RNA helicase DDX18/HAS1